MLRWEDLESLTAGEGSADEAMFVICVVLVGWKELIRCGHEGVGSWRRTFLAF